MIVEPSVKIDNAYDFLFYEASLNYKFTLNKGWIINKDSFNEEMSSIVTFIGLNSKERADFIEYWSKELKWQSSRYAVYYLDPKEINEAIKLNLSKEPDSILRAYFYFVPLEDNIYLNTNKPLENYKRLLNTDYFVDKSMIIEKTNKIINTANSYICITRPRRFGKPSVADMIGACYSKAVDSKEIFDNLNISKSSKYEEYLNNYN